MIPPILRSGVTALLTALGALLLAACGSPPQVRFHSLLPPDVSVPAPATPGGVPLRVVVAPVGVPAAVDQPQWLVRRGDETLQALEEDRWASPLRDELRAALRDGLATRWGVVDGSRPGSVDRPDDPASANAATGGAPAGPPVTPSWRVVVEVLRLEARPSTETVLEARWQVVPPRAAGGRAAATATCRFLVREPAQGAGTVPLADAHRRAVARLTDDIGRQLRAMAGGASAACVGAPTA